MLLTPVYQLVNLFFLPPPMMDLLGLAVPLSQWHLKWQMPPHNFQRTNQCTAKERLSRCARKLIHRWRLSLVIIFCNEKEAAYSCQRNIGSWASLLLQGVSLDLAFPSFVIFSDECAIIIEPVPLSNYFKDTNCINLIGPM